MVEESREIDELAERQIDELVERQIHKQQEVEVPEQQELEAPEQTSTWPIDPILLSTSAPGMLQLQI